MSNNSRMMHDLKPERPDLAPPLPTVMMVLPVMFYLACAGAVGLGALFTVKTKQAQAEEQREMEAEQEERRQITALKAEQKVIDETQAKAKDVELWIDSTSPFMEVVSTVLNSMKPQNTLASLKLSRSVDNPEHTELRAEINQGGNIQQQEIVQALLRANYQTYRDDVTTPNKNDRTGAVTYSATLVRNSPTQE